MTRAIVVLFNRDLRVHDHPALAAAVQEADTVVPLFVLDDAILESRFAAPNRLAFLHDCLTDLDTALLARGAGLVVRRGSVVAETVSVAREVGADAVFTSADVSAYSKSRDTALTKALECELRLFPGATVVDPGAVTPAAGDHYKVFTPYWRAWRALPRRPLAPTPARLQLARGVRPGGPPSRGSLLRGEGPVSPSLPRGGESEARRRLSRWAADDAAAYETHADDLAGDATSRLSPYLRFGCISPLEVSERSADEAFNRQLCWRDFHYQVTDAFPAIATRDYRSRARSWRRSEEELTAWKDGRTGVPVVDAGMRQLLAEGWMHNRVRMITASFLTKDLHVWWPAGARHFLDHLVDGDLASNNHGWQWVAGTGTDAAPYFRVFNPITQGTRFDPRGDYVRRWVPELAHLTGKQAHTPWDAEDGYEHGYPRRIVDHAEERERALSRYQRGRG